MAKIGRGGEILAGDSGKSGVGSEEAGMAKIFLIPLLDLECLYRTIGKLYYLLDAKETALCQAINERRSLPNGKDLL